MSCSMLIDEALEDLPGVRRSQTDFRGFTTVDFDPQDVDPETIVSTIEDTGYHAELQTATLKQDK